VRGYRVCIFEETPSGLDYGMGLDFARAINAAGAAAVERIPYKSIYRELGPQAAMTRIAQWVDETQPDILLFLLDDCVEFPPSFFSALGKGRYSIIYIGDDEHYFDRSSRYYAQAFDLVLLANYLNIFRFELYGIDARFLPSAYDVAAMGEVATIDAPEVVFVGALKHKVGREAYVEHLRRNGVSIALYGAGTEGGVVDRKRMNELFKSAKISLGFTGVATNSAMDYDLSVNRRIKQVKGRCQEIALAGGFILCEYAPGLERMFSIGEEIAVFRNATELLDKVRYYLAHPEQRDAMAQRAHARAINDYDAAYQWRLIGEHVCALIGESRRLDKGPLMIDPIFERAFAAFHASLFIAAVAGGKWRKAWSELRMLAGGRTPDLGLLSRRVGHQLAVNLAKQPRLRAIVRLLLGRAA
jgi:spore maturation protein CgeB